MLMQNSITAGRILSLLDQEKRAMTLSELAYYLEEDYHYIQNGVERLIKEGLAVLDMDHDLVKVEHMPKFIEKEMKQEASEYKELAFA